MGSSPYIVYFSSQSEYTHKFVTKLNIPHTRIPLDVEEKITVDVPYVLITPTYGGSVGKERKKGAVPKQVIQFLNDKHNRGLIRGVIACGNTNFGAEYGLAGDIISSKCSVPYLYRLELMGTEHDVVQVQNGLSRFWLDLHTTSEE